jgi:hypothetical protein
MAVDLTYVNSFNMQEIFNEYGSTIVLVIFGSILIALFAFLFKMVLGLF